MIRSAEHNQTIDGGKRLAARTISVVVRRSGECIARDEAAHGMGNNIDLRDARLSKQHEVDRQQIRCF